jgi:hypothetical protein
MSRGSSVQFQPTLDEADWADIEIPYGLYSGNWQNEHSDRLQRLVEDGNILKRHFTPHWELCPDVSGTMPEKNIAIEKLRTTNKQWGAALLSGYEFAKGTGKDQVIKILDDEVSGISTPFDKTINNVIGSNDKKGAILLLDLVAPRRLKDIYVLTRLRRRSPVQRFDVTATSTPLQTMDVSRFLEEFDSASRDFREWHSFDFKNNRYLAIKIHDSDNVRIQTDENLQVEEADVLILKEIKNEVEVYTQETAFLGATQQGIARGVEAGDPSITSCNVDVTGATVQHQTYADAIDDIKNDNFGNKLTLHKLITENAPVSGSAKISVSKGTNGVWDTLDSFRNSGIDLLENPDSVSQIGFIFDSKKFTLYPEPVSRGTSITYRGGVGDEQLRTRFETEIKSQLGLKLIFRQK